MTRARWSPITWRWWSVLRVSVMLLLGALVAWMFSDWGQEEAPVGAVLAAVAACGFIVKPGREAAYAVGAVLVVASLFLGVRDADGGMGYCDSVFEVWGSGIEGADIESVAPAGLIEHCREVRADRVPIMGALAFAGVVSLALAARRRRLRLEPADHATNAPANTH